MTDLSSEYKVYYNTIMSKKKSIDDISKNLWDNFNVQLNGTFNILSYDEWSKKLNDELMMEVQKIDELYCVLQEYYMNMLKLEETTLKKLHEIV